MTARRFALALVAGLAAVVLAASGGVLLMRLGG